ncbi:MAG: hypothetical protein K2X74_19855 [Acetobacteraceae bacterium]|nr:hypothetical protein [Acetobacteraceae bacterium]
MSGSTGSGSGSGSGGGSGGGGGGNPRPDWLFTTTIQAESADILGGAAIGDDVAGFNGSGYVTLPPDPGGFLTPRPRREDDDDDGGGDGASSAAAEVTFTVTVPRDGYYTLDFRYATESATVDAYRNVLVNGEDLPGAVQFENRYADDVWSIASDRVRLEAGTHTITVTADMGEEVVGIVANPPDIRLDQLTITEGTRPSDQTSARSQLMNNGEDLVAIHEAAFTSAKDITDFGPYLSQLRHASNWEVDQIDFSTMWFRDEADGRTLGPRFDSTQYFDEKGILRVEYGDYLPTGEDLPVSITRDYAMVPGESLLVERWTLTNEMEVGDPLIEWDVMNVLALNPDLQQRAVWDEQLETWIVRLDQGEGEKSLWMAFGAYQEMTSARVDTESAGLEGGRIADDFGADGALGGRERANGEGLVLGMALDSVDLYPTRPVELYFYTTIAESRDELRENVAKALNPQNTASPGSPTYWFEKTEADWEARLAEARDIPLAAPTGQDGLVEADADGIRAVSDPALETAYLRSLVTILQSQNPEFGSFVAATNPAYEFKVWPRDGAATAISLDAAGMFDEAEAYWRWMASVEEDGVGDRAEQFPNGSFYTNYSFWEQDQPIDFVQPEWDAQGLFLIGVQKHYEALVADGQERRAERFVNDPVVREAFIDSANFISDRVDETGFGPPEFSIWEEFFLYNVFTQVTYAQGLNAAVQLAEAIGAEGEVAAWTEAANSIRDAMLRETTAEPNPGLWNEQEGYFAWGVTPDGEGLVDRQENSANLAIVTGLLDANDPRALQQIQSSIDNTSHDGFGISRYVGDTFYSSSPYSPGGTYESRVDEAVWPQMTSYVGMAKEFQGDLDWAYGSLQWITSVQGEGFAPPGEGVDWSTREPLPSTMSEPVTAGWYIQNLLNYTGQYDPRLSSDIYGA